MKRVAQILSIIFHPVFIAIYSLIFMFLSTHIADVYINNYGISYLQDFFLYSFILTIGVPLLTLGGLWALGRIDSINIDQRADRIPIYIPTIITYITFVYFTHLKLQLFVITLFFVFAVLAIILITIINLWWKVSAHSCGMGVFCSFLFYLQMLTTFDYFWWIIGAILFSGAVMSSRLILQVHTVRQTVIGYFIGLMAGVIPTIIFFI